MGMQVKTAQQLYKFWMFNSGIYMALSRRFLHLNSDSASKSTRISVS